jgi:ribosome-associated protein
MIKSKQDDASKQLSEVIVRGMQEKKALDIVVMDLREVKNAVADFFVICSGTSDKQLAAIAESVDVEVFKTLNEDPWSKEGKHNKEWMLLDYVSVVVHIFKKERREFYSLEKLWGDAVLTQIKEIRENRAVGEAIAVPEILKVKGEPGAEAADLNKIVVTKIKAPKEAKPIKDKKVKVKVKTPAKAKTSVVGAGEKAKTTKKVKVVSPLKKAKASKPAKKVKAVKLKKTVIAGAKKAKSGARKAR